MATVIYNISVTCGGQGEGDFCFFGGRGCVFVGAMSTGIKIQDSRRPFFCLDAPASVLILGGQKDVKFLKA